MSYRLEEHIDLTSHIDDFDRVLRAIDYVVEHSTSLSLDDAQDRETLKERLTVALGSVTNAGEIAPRHLATP